jgi:integrase
MSKLTAKEVEKKTTPGLHGDGAGLTLQITKTGVKSWLFRYMIDGKAYGMGLGPVHTITLAQARQRATDARRLVLDGINPLEAKRKRQLDTLLAQARSMTFDQCASAYIEAHLASWKNAKHGQQWENTLAAYASPVIGSLPVASVDTALVMTILSPIWSEKTETASRLRGRIESVLDWATTSGYREGVNPARWKGHLENLLASISKAQRTKNHPSLPWQQVCAFMAELRGRKGIAARSVEFAILCAARSGEVRGMAWAEVDGEVWTIPASRMKAKREHQVPLSSAALTLLNSMPRMGDLVFPGTKGQPLSDMSLTAVLRRMNSDTRVWKDKDSRAITVHGFRSSFRMWAAESTNYPREVAEHALAHQLPDVVERAYQRGTQFAKRGALMDEWARFCATESIADDVIANRHTA